MRDRDDDRFDDDETGAEVPVRRSRATAFALALLRRPRDTLAGAAGLAALATITINALFMQPGPHPAPLFVLKQDRLVSAAEATGTLAVLPRPRPLAAPAAPRSEPAAAVKAPPGRPRAEIVTDIQRELTRRGYYDGPINGVFGSKTTAAIRDFEQVAGLPASAEPSEAILKSITRAPAKPKPAPAAAAPRPDPIAGLIGPDARVKAVQRALALYGYGQVKANGLYDPDTRNAIEAFETARRLPVTGEINDRLLRELAAVTGQAIE